MNIPFTAGGPQPAGDPGLYGLLRQQMEQQNVVPAPAPPPMAAPAMAAPPMPQAPAAPAMPAPQQGPEIEVQLAGEVVGAAASGQLNLPKFLDAIVQIAQGAAQQQEAGPAMPMGPQMGGPAPMGPAF